MSNRLKKTLWHLLGALLALVALNAFAGGYYALSGAKDVPIEWLDGSPFKNYFIPGLILFTVVGGTFLLAAIATFMHWRVARLTTYSAVAIVFIWLGVQIAIVGYVSWMQPATAITAALTLFIALLIFEGSGRRRQEIRRRF